MGLRARAFWAFCGLVNRDVDLWPATQDTDYITHVCCVHRSSDRQTDWRTDRLQWFMELVDCCSDVVCVLLCLLVRWTVLWSSRSLHVLPSVQLPRHDRVLAARRRRVEDAVSRTVLHRPYQCWIAGCRRRTSADLGDEQWRPWSETGQCQVVFPTGAYTGRPTVVPRRGHCLLSC